MSELLTELGQVPLRPLRNGAAISRGYSTQAEIVIGRKSGVFEDAHGQTATNVATGMNGDGDGHASFRMPQREMAG